MTEPRTVERRAPELWGEVDGARFIADLARGGTWDAPHAQLLGYRIVAVSPGRIELDWEVPEALLNPAGIAHGGFLVALLDDAAGLAVASRYPRFVPQLTVQLTTDFLAAVPPGVTHRVEGTLVRGGRSTNVADAVLRSPDGAVLTRCTGIFQPNRAVVPREHWHEAGLGSGGPA
ncbi:MAG: PaaI family thioesterase [Actinobacteria bacterium]|nr:PaaI family thioesterase [Actinomycetota bacterium]